MVLDEVPRSDGHFARLGAVREGVVPLWIHALQ
jgi:hypothetical protein